MSAAFSKLHPKIQEAVWRQGWAELRPLQTDAIDCVLDTEEHLILAAATAAGKTEAAFLPVLSRLAEEPEGSVQALYISPLKALINDQFGRLETLCASAEISVHRWHGDVSATDKQRLRQSPGGVLLITPESLESQFINHDRYLHRIYAQLRFVVIDELHAFLDNVRGIHLQSLLARLNIAAGVTPRRVGLSATIGDFEPARAFLCADAPQTVRVVEDGGHRKELRVRLNAYLDAREPDQSEQQNTAPTSDAVSGLAAVAADLAQRFRRGSNLIFCNSRRQAELLADQIRVICERECWPSNPFLLHHGSLSRELREEAEEALRSECPVTAICTSTLEMGIDLGSVRAVGQVGPTRSVASLVQRLGRSGWRDGEAQILRLYTLDEPLTPKSSLTERLFPELIRGIALLELHRDRWLDPPEASRFHFSTCVHQILSILRQTGGATAKHLLDVLCRRGAFTQVAPEQFAALLRGLAVSQLIEQIPTDELILAPSGERIVQSYHFYAAFAGTIEYRIEQHEQQIGVLPADSVPAEGEFLLFAGRRWRIESVDHAGKRVAVTPAKGWKQPTFSGGIGGLHATIVQRMRRVLTEDAGYPYLSPSAIEFLDDGRKTFAAAGLDKADALTTGNGIEWFPWQSSRVLLTIELCAKTEGIATKRDDLCLRFEKLSGGEFSNFRAKVARGAFSAGQLMSHVAELQRDRFDEYIPQALLQQAYLAEVLDLAGAQAAAAKGYGRAESPTN